MRAGDIRAREEESRGESERENPRIRPSEKYTINCRSAILTMDRPVGGRSIEGEGGEIGPMRSSVNISITDARVDSRTSANRGIY